MEVAKKKRRTQAADPVLMGLAALRKRAGLSQSALAEKIDPDLDETAVSHWETGRASPPAAKLPRIAELLSCTIDDLFHEAAAS